MPIHRTIAVISLIFQLSPAFTQSTEQESLRPVFDIIFKQDFESTPPGPYQKSEWKKNWNNPRWANSAAGFGTVVRQRDNNSLRISFPAGKMGLDSSGVQWHTLLGKTYNELYFSYRIKFSAGFTSKHIHGKLPGLSGGSSNTGGRLPTGTDGWSARYMFHGTSIFFYLYYPDMYKHFGDMVPRPEKKYYGAGVNLSPGFTLKPGEWYTITQRIVMNTPGEANGLVEGYINGKLCALKTNMRFRDSENLGIDRINFANFLGGSGKPPANSEFIEFDDFVVFVYQPWTNAPKGNSRNAADKPLLLPDLRMLEQ